MRWASNLVTTVVVGGLCLGAVHLGFMPFVGWFYVLGWLR